MTTSVTRPVTGPVTQDVTGSTGTSLLNGLVSWWSLDETSGTRYDSHGSYDLTDNNGVGYAAGKEGNAASFDATAASAQYFTHAHNTDFVIGNRDFTIAGWAYMGPNTETSAHVISKGPTDASGKGWAVQRNSTGISMRFLIRNAADTNWYATSAIAVSVATWFFFIAEYDAGAETIRFEINRGTPQTAAATGGGLTPDPSSQALQIGTNTAGSRDWDGYIDEVAIWHKLLSSDEKSALYNSGSGVGYPG